MCFAECYKVHILANNKKLEGPSNYGCPRLFDAAMYIVHYSVYEYKCIRYIADGDRLRIPQDSALRFFQMRFRHHLRTYLHLNIRVLNWNCYVNKINSLKIL